MALANLKKTIRRVKKTVLKKYKKKVRGSKLYKKGGAGRRQKRVDILAKKRKLGVGKKKRIQRRINRVIGRGKRKVARTAKRALRKISRRKRKK